MMFSSNNCIEHGLGPCQNMVEATVGGLDQVAKALDPAAKCAMRANLEIVALVNRRAQAYLEIPSRLAQCRAPQDLFQEQAPFWQTAMAQYQESSRQVMSLWSAALPAVNMFGGFERAAETVRDYITYPEPSQTPDRQPDRQPERRRDGRRAA